VKIKARDNISMLLEENVDERCESKFSDYTPERQRRSMSRKRKYSRKNKKGGAINLPLPAPLPVQAAAAAAAAAASAPVHRGLWDIITPITNLVTNAAIKGTTTLTKMAADTIGVDTTKNDLPGVIQEFTEVINNPETQNVMTETAKTLGKDVSIFVEELKPSLDELGENALTLAKKEGNAGISALKDLTEEIPGVATFYVLNDVVKAGEAVVDAGAKTTEIMANTLANTENKIEEMKKMGESNLNALQKQGLDAQKRI